MCKRLIFRHETIADLQNLIDSADLGIRLEVEEAGTLSMFNEVRERG